MKIRDIIRPLLQEIYQNNPWKMLVCCMLLNLTNRKCFNCGNGMREIKSKTRIGVGSAALKKDARQRSSLNALQALERMGFKKPVPAYYQTLL